MLLRHYILDENGKPVQEPDLLTWALWFETAERHVALTEIGDIKISTVFLGIDHNYGFDKDPTPVLYETMVFGGALDEDMRRYCTREEAQAGHAELVAAARATLA
jgi:hypothetical protein